MRLKHIGTDKEKQYDEPEVIDEVWVRKDGQLVKLEEAETDADAQERQ